MSFLKTSSTLATILGTLITLAWFLLARPWQASPQLSEAVAATAPTPVPRETPVRETTADGVGGPVPSPQPRSEEFRSGRKTAARQATTPGVSDSVLASPAELTLHDGEQRVFLGGELGISVGFSEVASTPLMTLVVNVGAQQERHAVLGAGARYRLTAAAHDYYLSVLQVDFRAREARLRLDPTAVPEVGGAPPP